MGDGLDQEKIDALWATDAGDVDRMMERVNDAMDFAVSPGSSLAGDDRASDPYQVSHAVQMCIVRDQQPALESLGLSDAAKKKAKYARLGQIAGRGAVQGDVTGGYRSTEAVTYADANAPTAKPLLSWQMCSGYAHGRPWVYLGMADENMIQETDEPGVLKARVTSDPGKLLYPSLHA